ncbi:MAG: hypothetical protein BWY94_00326 [Actinobacteria bacterium ADurb.BinA094]|nr:MAG: hypothetical protein BWY94_00326 [Actinobacteria bacterium ADurb.BinA094]
MIQTFRPITRRRFGFSLCGLPPAFSRLAAGQDPMPWNEPAVVAKVYLAAPRVHWPKPDLDLQADIAEVEARLADVQRKNARWVRFTGGELLRTDAEAGPWLERHADAADGVLIVPLSAPMQAIGPLVNGLKAPALYFSRPYAGHGWAGIAAMRGAGRKIDALATSSYGDLDPYMRIFHAARHLRHSKVLIVGRNREKLADAYAARFGTAYKVLDYPDLQACFDAADSRKAGELAREFTAGALRVVEPKPREIHDALRFYLGVSALMRRERANAVTVDCFGGLLAKQMPAYPCVAWSRLNDQGLYGVCEGDLQSTMTQMLVTPCSGMPGFVTDPVFDLSRNEVIHAHCVAATKMKGIDGPSYPYILRDHLETAEGVAMQVLMPSGETITMARFVGADRMLVSTGEVTGMVESDRGCRSQIRTRVADAAKMLAGYGSGLHRVIFYGDHVRTIERMGRMMGFRVEQEG